MGKVLLDITMPLVGFITGPNDDVERLREWVIDGKTADECVGDALGKGGHQGLMRQGGGSRR